MPRSRFRIQSFSWLLIAMIIGFFNPKSIYAQPKNPTLTKYATIRLTANLDSLSEQQKQMLVLLMEAGQEMDRVF